MAYSLGPALSGSLSSFGSAMSESINSAGAYWTSSNGYVSSGQGNIALGYNASHSSSVYLNGTEWSDTDIQKAQLLEMFIMEKFGKEYMTFLFKKLNEDEGEMTEGIKNYIEGLRHEMRKLKLEDDEDESDTTIHRAD
jgi:hypothetical protein